MNANTTATIKALTAKMNAAKAELQKERANKDRILRPFAHKGLDDSFDFPDEYYESAKRIRALLEFGGKCQKAISLLKEIEVRAEQNYYLNDNKELFETNVGSTGSFNIEEQEIGDRARFYIDLGKFLSDPAKLARLKNRMFLFAETLEDIRDCVRRINAELEHPLGL